MKSHTLRVWTAGLLSAVGLIGAPGNGVRATARGHAVAREIVFVDASIRGSRERVGQP